VCLSGLRATAPTLPLGVAGCVWKCRQVRRHGSASNLRQLQENPPPKQVSMNCSGKGGTKYLSRLKASKASRERRSQASGKNSLNRFGCGSRITVQQRNRREGFVENAEFISARIQTAGEFVLFVAFFPMQNPPDFNRIL
jgi:hypothetical protein